MMCRLRAAEIPEQELKQRCADGTMYADFVPIGHWIDRFGGEYRCSECGAKISEEDITDTPIKSFNFCPNCGADMRENNTQFRTFPDTEQNIEDRFRDIVTGNTPDAWKFNVNAHGGVHLIVNHRKEDGDTE